MKEEMGESGGIGFSNRCCVEGKELCFDINSIKVRAPLESSPEKVRQRRLGGWSNSWTGSWKDSPDTFNSVRRGRGGYLSSGNA